MVHIKKDYDNPPAALIDAKWDLLKADVLITKNNHKVNTDCYREATIDDLVILYNHKCACCERSRGYELQVDHYRPKKARLDGDASLRHSGYYWLTYEWANLIPLCSSCNNKKSNYFPIKGVRVIEHTVTNAYDVKKLHEQEKPLFLNPEIEEKPILHFKYFPNGEIKGITEEGKITIKYANLNVKTKVRERNETIKNYINSIEKAIGKYIKSEEIDKKAQLKGALETVFGSIVDNTKEIKPFSLLHQYIFFDFENFIAKKLPTPYDIQIVDLFVKFKEKNA